MMKSPIIRVMMKTKTPGDAFPGTEEQQSSDANGLGHYQVAGDYREGAGG